VNARFRKQVEGLEGKFQQLRSAKAFRINGLPKNVPISGIYLFSEGKKHLYVGRSRKIRRRLNYHCSGNCVVATFAFHLAREGSGLLKATYKKGKGTRKELAVNPKFMRAFAKATKRVREMRIRFVEETDPIRQAFLELYAAISLKTKYNKFATS